MARSFRPWMIWLEFILLFFLSYRRRARDEFLIEWNGNNHFRRRVVILFQQKSSRHHNSLVWAIFFFFHASMLSVFTPSARSFNRFVLVFNDPRKVARSLDRKLLAGGQQHSCICPACAQVFIISSRFRAIDDDWGLLVIFTHYLMGNSLFFFSFFFLLLPFFLFICWQTHWHTCNSICCWAPCVPIFFNSCESQQKAKGI